jgi:hypothetical protein
MRARLATFVDENLPDLDPVIAHERTDYGWRGLTAQGEVLEVKQANGHAIEVPSEIVVAQNGLPVGRRKVGNERPLSIDNYLEHFNRVVSCYRANNLAQAMLESDLTIAVAPTLRARFNRAMVLLAAGQWQEGLAEYWLCEQEAPFMRPQARAALDAGMQPWRGEDLQGKRLLLMHAHGFGDSIMMLRYVPVMRARGAEVILMVPRELERLAAQHAAVVNELVDADYFCPLLHLLHFLKVIPSGVIGRGSYLEVDASDVECWRAPKSGKKNIGIAWSIGKPSLGDYPREIELKALIDVLRGDGEKAEIHSVQIQGAEEARKCGVKAYEFEDFADCAALMMAMDEIVSVDTAALHLAGAIGHPRVFGLLSHWASWRWVAPWYSNIEFRRQPAEGDWLSALLQI